MPTDFAFLLERITVGLDPVNGCWIWTGQLNDKGYARDSWGDRKEFIHRVIFEACVGRPVLEGLVLGKRRCHPCRLASQRAARARRLAAAA